MGTEMEQTSPFVTWILASYAAYPWVGLLMLMMVLDVVSGVVAAIYERKLSSKIGYRGMMKKAAVMLVIGVCYLVEQAIYATVPKAIRPEVIAPIAKIAAGFFLFNEAISVLENAKRTGVPLPAFLSKSLIETMGKLSKYATTGETSDRIKIEMTEGKLEGTIIHQNPVVPVAVVPPEPPPQQG